MTASNSTNWPSNQPLGAAIGQYAIGEGPSGGAPRVPVDGFLGNGFSTPVRKKIGLYPHLQGFYTADTVPFPPSEGIGWFAQFSDPVRQPKINRAALWPYQAYVGAETQNDPNLSFAEVTTYSRYAYAWSEPVRQKGQWLPGLRAALQQSWTSDTVPLPESDVFDQPHWWSMPVRVKLGTPPHLQQTIAFYPTPVVNYGYPQWLSTPVRKKIGLPSYLQQSYTDDTIALPVQREFPWFDWWSEPKRFKVLLRTDLQQWYPQAVPPNPSPETFAGYRYAYSNPIYPPKVRAWHVPYEFRPARLLPPANVTATLAATEINADVALLGLYVYDTVTPTTSGLIANVSIIEIPAIQGGAGSIEG